MKAKLMMVIFLALAVIAMPAYAQEMAEPEVQDDEMEIPEIVEEDLTVTYGTVVSVSAEQVVILEYDFDLDKDIEVTYITGEDTVLEEVEKLDDLKEEDPVEIVYEEKEGKRVALLIKKEDFGLNDADSLEELDSAEGMDETLDDLESPDQEMNEEEAIDE